MQLGVRGAVVGLGVAAAGAIVWLLGMPVSGQGQTYRAPRTADGKPNLNGIWQAVNTANWDVQDHAARQGPVVARVRSVFRGPQPHHRHACNEPDPSDRRSSRRAGTLAQRLQSGGGARCHPWRWACHASAILALSTHPGPDAQGAERTGGDMGLLRATAVELATVAKVESNGVAPSMD